MLTCLVGPANTHDGPVPRDLIIALTPRRARRGVVVFADAGYSGQGGAAACEGYVLELVELAGSDEG